MTSATTSLLTRPLLVRSVSIAGTGYPAAFALAAVVPPLALAAAVRAAGKGRTSGEARTKVRSG